MTDTPEPLVMRTFTTGVTLRLSEDAIRLYQQTSAAQVRKALRQDLEGLLRRLADDLARQVRELDLSAPTEEPEE